MVYNPHAVGPKSVVITTVSVRASDFQTSGPLKKQTAGKRLKTNTDVKQALASCLQTPDTKSLHAGIDVLVPWRDKCLNVTDHHVEVMCTTCYRYGTYKLRSEQRFRHHSVCCLIS